MKIVIYFDNKVLLSYVNTDNSHNKIPNSFEKLSTQLGCPRCTTDSLVELLGYHPCIDNICSVTHCHHTVETKSILAEGSQEKAFEKGKSFMFKLGSRRHYEYVNKKNKSLIIYWYNIIFQDENLIKIKIRNVVLISMELLLNGINCKTFIQLQKKKTKLKERLAIEIFPRLQMKELYVDDFKYKNSMNTKRQNQVFFYNIIINQVKRKKYK